MGDAISYIRVSSDDQADSGLGLEAQRQRIADYFCLEGLRAAMRPIGFSLATKTLW
jgi:hypothetical protein